MQTDALMMFDKLTRPSSGSNGRAKAGPYTMIRPAEAGAGRSRSPACEEGFSPSQGRDPLQRVRGAGAIFVCKNPPRTHPRPQTST
ncbi:MAG TPA: hypothetical protein VHV10_00800 [Ktedonobacteraceae bacterium]|nr:hypothetical protein [Ktedonobacteraceae bacterium]